MLRKLWAAAQQVREEVPATMPDHCYVRAAGSDIVDVADRVGEGKWKLAVANVVIDRLDGIEWSPTTTRSYHWKPCTTS